MAFPGWPGKSRFVISDVIRGHPVKVYSERIMKTALCQTAIGCVIGFVVSTMIRTSVAATSQPPIDSQSASTQASGNRGRGLAFTEPSPLDFDDHAGYISIFDGKTLDGWDGNPKFWRVRDGAIVGESTAERPSGNSYIAYRRLEVKDFTAKFEIKVEGTGGSGLQYRSRTGLPWLANIPANVAAFNGPVNLNWMMTGPQADFWPSRVYTGQFYSENTPMRILAWRGQVVEGFGDKSKRLMGTIGDRQALGQIVKAEDWNQYTVIARGGTFLHIVNGQLMAVMIDDDPASSNNWSGQFGIEIEATTTVSVRNIWVKKLR
jgi:3-keto-disaccharide hydrolase